MILPNKELLSAVLGEECIPLEIVVNTLYYKVSYAENTLLEINIYELIHKMKEWAYNTYGLELQSGRCCGVYYCWDETTGYDTYMCDASEAKTEPEAVTKACEWILEQQK